MRSMVGGIGVAAGNTTTVTTGRYGGRRNSEFVGDVLGEVRDD